MLAQLQLEVFRSVLVGLLCVVLLFLCARRKQKKLNQTAAEQSKGRKQLPAQKFFAGILVRKN